VGGSGEGCEPRLVVASRSARDIPLGVFAPWLESVVDGPPDVSMLHRAADVLSAGGPRTLLGVDDAHLLDGVSATVLHQLAMRRAVRMVLTVRTGEEAPDAVTALWKDDLAERIELAPLSEPDAAARQRLFTTSRGNALWLRHLIEGERAAGRLARTAGTWRWTGEPVLSSALGELVGARIGELSAAQREVLELLAFGEPVGLGMLGRLCDEQAIEETSQRGLVLVEPDGARWAVRLGHPLYGEVVRAWASPPRARRLRGLLSDALGATGGRRVGDGLRQAVLGLDSDLPGDARLLVEAAGQAGAFSDLDLAERLFRAARAAGGGFDAQLGLGLTVCWLMRGEEAEIELEQASKEATTGRQLARATLSRVGNMYFTLARPQEAYALLEEAERALGTGPGRADLDAVRAYMHAASNDLPQARALASAVVSSPDPSWSALTWAGWALVAVHGFTGRGEDHVEALARDAVRAAGMSVETVAMQANIGFFEVFGLAIEGRLEPARARARWMRERQGDYSAVFGALYEGRIALDTGQVGTAVGLLGSVLPFFPGHGGGWTAWFELMTASALGMSGDGTKAAATLERARAAVLPGMRIIEPELGLAGAWVAAARGATGEAVAVAGRAADLAEATGQRAMEVLIRHTAVCFGDRSQAAPLAVLARVVDGPRAPAAAAHAAGLAARDPVAVLEASAALEDAELLLFAADAAAQAAVLHREAGQPGPAIAAAHRTARLAGRCDGARTPALVAGTSPISISDRDREVATLAAAGLTNRQVADRMQMSVRTVESHIYRACSRLGLADRAEFIAVVAPGAEDHHRKNDKMQ